MWSVCTGFEVLWLTWKLALVPALVNWCLSHFGWAYLWLLTTHLHVIRTSMVLKVMNNRKKYFLGASCNETDTLTVKLQHFLINWWKITRLSWESYPLIESSEPMLGDKVDLTSDFGSMPFPVLLNVAVSSFVSIFLTNTSILGKPLFSIAWHISMCWCPM